MMSTNERAGEGDGAPRSGEEMRECAGLHAAYSAFRADPGKGERYVAVLEALEGDLKADAFCFLPVREAKPSAVAPNGRIQWNVTDTSKGRMLSVFTSREQVEKHPAPASVCVKLRAAFQMALSGEGLVGILLNPSDGRNGVPIERRNLEVMASRIRGEGGRVPQLHPGVVSNAVYRLWEIAVGVPTAVYDVSSEVKRLGGMERILAPLLEKWQSRLRSSPGEFPEPMDYVRIVLRDVVSSGFVYGAMALKNPDRALEADVERCIDAIPDLREDIGQNLDEYLILISDAIRAGLKEPNEAHVQLMVAGNLPLIAFGAINFALGWGMAKDAESQGVMPLAELRDRQQAWIERFKQSVAERLKKEREMKADEDGK